MIFLWFVKIKLFMSELEDVPERYHQQVLDKLVEEGLFDVDGNRL